MIITGGKYIITDPCYLFKSDEEWQELCNEYFGKGDNGGVINYEGYKIFWSVTHHGDGSYETFVNGIRKGLVGVDAGLLAAIPFELAKKLAQGFLDSDNEDVYIETNLTTGVFVPCDKEGLIHFSNATVETGWLEDDEDEDIEEEF